MSFLLAVGVILAIILIAMVGTAVDGFRVVTEFEYLIKKSLKEHGFTLVEARSPEDEDWEENPFRKVDFFQEPRLFDMDYDLDIRNVIQKHYAYIVTFTHGKVTHVTWVHVHESLFRFNARITWAIPLAHYA